MAIVNDLCREHNSMAELFPSCLPKSIITPRVHVVRRRDEAGIARSKMHRVCGATAGHQVNFKDVNKSKPYYCPTASCA